MAMEEIKEPLELLADDEPISKATTLNHNVYFFLNPESRKVEAVIASGPFGVSEYDADAGKYVPLGESETWRVRNLFNTSVKYITDWKNPNAFDENDKSIALEKYSDGSLDEAWLKENAKFAGDVSTEK